MKLFTLLCISVILVVLMSCNSDTGQESKSCTPEGYHEVLKTPGYIIYAANDTSVLKQMFSDGGGAPISQRDAGEMIGWFRGSRREVLTDYVKFNLAAMIAYFDNLKANITPQQASSLNILLYLAKNARGEETIVIAPSDGTNVIKRDQGGREIQFYNQGSICPVCDEDNQVFISKIDSTKK